MAKASSLALGTTTTAVAPGHYNIPIVDRRFGDEAPDEEPFADRRLPGGRWEYTDDTQMALSVVETLARHGRIDQDALAHSFGARFERGRGYGQAMYDLLPQLRAGVPWQRASRSLFGGQGSFGNGGAMRIAPLGAYFADDLPTVAEQAALAAIWRTADGLGDIDTNCAIVGSIVAARVGMEGLPADWMARREPLPGWAFGAADVGEQ